MFSVINCITVRRAGRAGGGGGGEGRGKGEQLSENMELPCWDE